jgi:hypothetical protein
MTYIMFVADDSIVSTANGGSKRPHSFSAASETGLVQLDRLRSSRDSLRNHRALAGKVDLDEPEALIYRRAATIGVALFWVVFVLSCIGVWAYLSFVRHQATVPIGFLLLLVSAGMFVFMVTRSIAILVQYRRSAGDDTL